MRMDHPFILGFCQKVTFDIAFTRICHLFGKINFLKLLSYFNHFVYLRFKNGRSQIIIISKQNSYFLIIFSLFPYYSFTISKYVPLFPTISYYSLTISSLFFHYLLLFFTICHYFSLFHTILTILGFHSCVCKKEEDMRHAHERYHVTHGYPFLEFGGHIPDEEGREAQQLRE